MTNSYEIVTLSGMKAYCWYSDYWVKFTLNIGTYKNIIEFLKENRISFLANMEIDFTTIPNNLHGAGYSYNLYSYLANNIDDIELIIKFINYFISTLTQIKYAIGKKLIFTIVPELSWQDSSVSISSPYTPPTTTTTTTAITTTTTTFFVTSTTSTTSTISFTSESFELFGQTFII